MIYFPPELTREYILQHVSEEEIFEKFGVRVEKGMFRSPLRIDRHPTCRFFRKRNGRLTLHDFSGHFSGDCFDLVQRTRGCNFPQALEEVARVFQIIDGKPTRQPVKSEVVIGPRTECELRIASMPWDGQHLEWWEDYGVDIRTLNKFNVVPVKQVWLNGFLYYNRDFTKKTEVVFAYKFGAYDYKVYFPQREKTRFLHNNPDILQGYSQLPETGDFVVITKSMKDVICLSMFGVPAIAPMSETSVVTDSTLEALAENFKKIFALYDRDRTGIIALLNLKRRGVTPLLMPRGTAKDFADYCKIDLADAQGLVHDFVDSFRKKQSYETN